jgi:uncharacterized coiled-coil DUF342 family protein
MGRDRREGRLEASEPMSEPLRFKPVNPAHEMIYSTDGGWVSWEDYQSLKDTLQCSFNSNRELKAEVEELKSQPDPLTAYLYAAELAKDDIKRLKAEVERLTAFTTRTIIPNEELQAQVERLTLASQGAVKYVDHTMALTRQSMEHHKQVSRLEAQVERLTKAGDALTEQLEGLGFDSVWDFWNAAKEGKQP